MYSCDYVKAKEDRRVRTGGAVSALSNELLKQCRKEIYAENSIDKAVDTLLSAFYKTICQKQYKRKENIYIVDCKMPVKNIKKDKLTNILTICNKMLDKNKARLHAV